MGNSVRKENTRRKSKKSKSSSKHPSNEKEILIAHMKPSDRDSDSYSFHDIPFVKMSQLNMCDQVETDEFKPYDICSSELSLANTDDPEKFLNTEYMIDKLLKQKKNEEKIFQENWWDEKIPRSDSYNKLVELQQETPDFSQGIILDKGVIAAANYVRITLNKANGFCKRKKKHKELRKRNNVKSILKQSVIERDI